MRVGARFVLVAVVACSAPAPVGPEGGAPVDSGQDTKPAADAEASACTKGETRCSDSLLGVETCDATGNWGDPVPCASQTCVNGACTGKCSQGETQCSGNSIETCDGTGNFAVSQTCPVACCNSQCIDTTSDTQNCGTCGNVCGAGLSCAKSFTAFAGAQPGDWTANGNAAYDSGNQAAELTPNAASQVGTWVFNRAIFVDDVTFQFDLYAGGGSSGDGLGFMLETNGTTALGAIGGGLGIAGLGGFGVEFDTYNNGECLDDSANHVGIDSLAGCGDGVPSSLVINDSPGFTIADGAWHTVSVHVTGGTFTVTADANTEFASYAPSGWANGNYYVGFGAGTGGATDLHEVRNVSVTFASPRCY